MFRIKYIRFNGISNASNDSVIIVHSNPELIIFIKIVLLNV